jgi:hypothetical protein
MSGDPSRGAISLEMEEPLLTGQKVQVSFCKRNRIRVVLNVSLIYAVHAQTASGNDVLFTKVKRDFLLHPPARGIHKSVLFNERAGTGFPTWSGSRK